MYYYKFDGDNLAHTLIADTKPDGYKCFVGNPLADADGYVNWTKIKLVNGNLQAVPIPEPPAPYVPTVAEVAQQKINEPKMNRNNAESATPFVYDGSSFDYDALSRERINAAVGAATIAAVSGRATTTVLCAWTLADNSSRDMTIADWLALRQAEIARSASCHATYNTKKAEVQSIVAQFEAGTKTADEAKSAINAVAW